MDSAEQALAPVSKAPLLFEPENVHDGYRLCNMLVSTGFLPKAIRTPQQALAMLMTGRDIGLSPMQSFRSLHVVEGKVEMSTDLMVGLVKRSGLCEAWRCVEDTPEAVTYMTVRKGDDYEHKARWTLEKAKLAGLLGKHNWKCYPEDMLHHRARSRLARRVYPDIVGNLYGPGEVFEASEFDPALRLSENAAAAETVDELQRVAAEARDMDPAEQKAVITAVEQRKEQIRKPKASRVLEEIKPPEHVQLDDLGMVVEAEPEEEAQ